MTCAGYDIGNGSSAVAVAKGKAIPLVLHDDSISETPSLVYFVERRRRFGRACETSEVLNPKSTISQLKCLVGKQFNSAREELQDLPFRTSEDKDGGGILIHVNHNREEYRFKTVHILAMLLSHLTKMVEGHQQMSHCVIGVPSYFTDKERIAYRDAAKIAGLKNMQLMHEGSAVALAYRFNRVTESDVGPSYVVFVDIGHCDTQVTVVMFDDDGIHVLAHASDPKLGGRDFTKVLYSHFAKEFKDKFEIDVSADCRARAQLMSECEKLKKALTTDREARIKLDSLMDGKDLVGSITRENFEELSSVLLEKLWAPCYRALRDARVTILEEYSVELVGSGSRIPGITSILEEKFQRKLCRSLDAKECVVHGCALQALTLSEVDARVNLNRVHDSLPFDVWWRTLSPNPHHNNSLFYKGAKFPTTKTIGIKHMNKKEPFDLHIEIFNDGGSQMTKSYKVGIGHILMPNNLIPTVEAKIGIDHDGITCLLSATLRLITPDHSLEDETMIKTKEWPSSDLPITETKMGLAAADFSEILELENKLVSMENSVREAQDRKHDLQVYIYAAIKKFNTGVYGDVVSSFEKVTYMNRLREMDKWLEDHDEEESLAYIRLLDSSKEIFHVIDTRQKSSEDCIEATKELVKSISNHKASAASLCSEEQRDSVNLVCSRAEEWLKACQQLQNFLPKNIDKSQVACDTRDMIKSLHQSCELIESNCALWLSKNSTCTSWTTYQFDDWDQDYTQTMINEVDDQFINNEERASAIYRLLYCIFRHRVAVICARTHEKDAVNKECDTCEKWLTTKWKKQELSPTNIDSILCAEEIEHNRKKLNRVCQEIQETIVSAAREDIINYISEVQKELEGRYASFANEEEKSIIFDRIKSVVAITNEKSNYGSEEFYTSHLMELENLVSPIGKRCTDKDRRDAAVQKLLLRIFEYRKVADIASDRQVKDEVKNKCKEVEKWLVEKTNLQELLPNYAEPVLCSDELDEKLQDIEIFCDQQLNKDRSIGYSKAEIEQRYRGSLFLSIFTSNNKGVEDMVNKRLPKAKKKSDILGELEFEIPKGVTTTDIFKALDRVHPKLSIKRYGLATYPTRR